MTQEEKIKQTGDALVNAKKAHEKSTRNPPLCRSTSVEKKEERTRIDVNVRWWDGYLETFEATEVRFGSDLLWMRMTNGQNRNIPLRGVRWWSQNPESHSPKEENQNESK